MCSPRFYAQSVKRYCEIGDHEPGDPAVGEVLVGLGGVDLILQPDFQGLFCMGYVTELYI
jgi:hypothetical protein